MSQENQKWEKKNEIYLVPIKDLRPNPDQPRSRKFDEELERLIEDIKRNGLLNPITMKEVDGETFIIDGHRRHHAFFLLDRDTIPAMYVGGDTFLTALSLNVHRLALSPMELAENLAEHMRRYGCTQDEAAKALNMTRTTANGYLQLNKLPGYIKAECQGNNAIPFRDLLKLAKLDDAGTQKDRFEKLIATNNRHEGAQPRGRNVNKVTIARRQTQKVVELLKEIDKTCSVEDKKTLAEHLTALIEVAQQVRGQEFSSDSADGLTLADDPTAHQLSVKEPMADPSGANASTLKPKDTEVLKAGPEGGANASTSTPKDGAKLQEGSIKL